MYARWKDPQYSSAREPRRKYKATAAVAKGNVSRYPLRTFFVQFWKRRKELIDASITLTKILRLDF